MEDIRIEWELSDFVIDVFSEAVWELFDEPSGSDEVTWDTGKPNPFEEEDRIDYERRHGNVWTDYPIEEGE